VYTTQTHLEQQSCSYLWKRENSTIKTKKCKLGLKVRTKSRPYRSNCNLSHQVMNDEQDDNKALEIAPLILQRILVMFKIETMKCLRHFHRSVEHYYNVINNFNIDVIVFNF